MLTGSNSAEVHVFFQDVKVLRKVPRERFQSVGSVSEISDELRYFLLLPNKTLKYYE